MERSVARFILWIIFGARFFLMPFHFPYLREALREGFLLRRANDADADKKNNPLWHPLSGVWGAGQESERFYGWEILAATVWNSSCHATAALRSWYLKEIMRHSRSHYTSKHYARKSRNVSLQGLIYWLWLCRASLPGKVVKASYAYTGAPSAFGPPVAGSARWPAVEGWDQ